MYGKVRSWSAFRIRIRFTVLRIRIWDPVPFWPLDPGSGIGFYRIQDLGSRIPNPYFWELRDNFLGKKFYNSLKIGPNFFLQHFKNKIVQFCEIYDPKKRYDNKFFSPMSFIAVFGSGIRDPGSRMGKNQDPGSGINIPDSPHCRFKKLNFMRIRADPNPQSPIILESFLLSDLLLLFDFWSSLVF